MPEFPYSPEQHRGRLVDLLTEAARPSRVKRMRFASPGVMPVDTAVNLHLLRTSLLLSGTLRTQYSAGEELKEIVQRSGDAFVYLPSGWNRHTYPATYSQIGMVVGEHHLRLYAIGPGNYPVQPQGPTWWYHTSRPTSPQTHQTLMTLAEIAEKNGDTETARWLFLALLRLCRDELANDTPRSGDEKAAYTFRLIHAYVQEHYQYPINRATTARVLGLHPNYLSRLFHEHCGETFVAHLARLRLEHAARLLRDTDLAVAQVAVRSGFGNQAHFQRAFRRLHGESPGAYRRRTP